ncbi:Uncharacterized protein YneR [Granulicatella balaenopterae]|uniref:Uncharacterized protein YneR n=1 Tax=Granulicatella balaenopterae TaxID=137733 RepID=A0A1H9LU47_9LACT|nr:iron-sulfur cluster biosynthesis protein [Granulicatella balaenopterae]SER14705.1 Uncharacterized protein YneR [Granulicatella balaenopterae]
MEIIIADKAQAWFAEEMGVSSQRGVRFLSKVYGCSPIHEGFSLAIEVDEPTTPYVLIHEKGIPYFIEKGDEWFFDGYDLYVDFDEQLEEPSYRYEKQ